MANHIEEAKSGRASCRTCKKTIAKGELRLGVEAANAFGDQPAMQWHHLMCAAQKLPAELTEALKAYVGDVPDRAALDAAIADAYTKGSGKPGGFPYVDKAPTGRAKCLQCRETIEKDSFRVAVERDLEMAGAMQKSAGYLHPKCVVAWLEANGGDRGETVEAIKANSRITDADVTAVLEQIV